MAAKTSKPKRKTKKDRVLALLHRKAGASISDMMKATDWQEHTVRGFLSGTVRKKLNLAITHDDSTGKARRYFVEKSS